jgi:hypothetical protein
MLLGLRERHPVVDAKKQAEKRSGMNEEQKD